MHCDVTLRDVRTQKYNLFDGHQKVKIYSNEMNIHWNEIFIHLYQINIYLQDRQWWVSGVESTKQCEYPGG